MSLFSELRRRNVVRVAIAYLAFSWLFIQIVDTVFPRYGFSDASIRAVMSLLAIGFPVVLLLSWIFEITPEGLKLERDVDRTHSMSSHTGKKLDRAIIVVLTMALGFFAIDKFVLDPGRDAKLVQQATQQARSEALVESYGDKSIAVMSFDNMSADESNDHFSDGISEELLNLLAKGSALRVISRSSSFSFKGKDLTSPEIAEQLNVAHLLDGSVRRAGNRVRITAQLIEARSDSQLWSDEFERDLTMDNLFEIQSEIAAEIVDALQVVLTADDTERMRAQPTTSLDAFREFTLGTVEISKRTAASVHQAQRHFEAAIELDPDYAMAYVGLANSIALQTYYSDRNLAESIAPRQLAIDKALALDPRSGEAYASLASLTSNQGRHEEAEEYYRKAIQLSPNYARAHHLYAVYLNMQDRGEEALPLVRTAIELDPISSIYRVNLAAVLWYMGRVEESNATMIDGIKRDPQFPSFYTRLFINLSAIGRLGEAQRWIRAGTQRARLTLGLMIDRCLGLLALNDEPLADQCLRIFERELPNTAAEFRAELLEFRGETQKAIDVLADYDTRNPSNNSKRYLAFAYVHHGDKGRARKILRELSPRYFDDGKVTVDHSSLDYAVFSAIALHADGEIDKANAIFDEALKTMRSMHRTRGRGSGILDVYIHVTRGEKQKAIQALRDAIDAGWRERWYYLRYAFFDTMRDEPEWNEIIAKLTADVERQRSWYEEHKDDPLI